MLTLKVGRDFGSRDWKTEPRGRSNMVDPLSESANVPSEVPLRLAALDCAELPLARTEDPEWLLVEEGFTLEREHEVNPCSQSGTAMPDRVDRRGGQRALRTCDFRGGVFDSEARSCRACAQLPTGRDCPPPSTAGRFGSIRVATLEHRRMLDMRQGILWREWRHQDGAGRITGLRELRLASLADRHLLVQSVTLTAENYSGSGVHRCAR